MPCTPPRPEQPPRPPCSITPITRRCSGRARQTKPGRAVGPRGHHPPRTPATLQSTRGPRGQPAPWEGRGAGLEVGFGEGLGSKAGGQRTTGVAPRPPFSFGGLFLSCPEPLGKCVAGMRGDHDCSEGETGRTARRACRLRSLFFSSDCRQTGSHTKASFTQPPAAVNAQPALGARAAGRGVRRQAEGPCPPPQIPCQARLVKKQAPERGLPAGVWGPWGAQSTPGWIRRSSQCTRVLGRGYWGPRREREARPHSRDGQSSAHCSSQGSASPQVAWSPNDPTCKSPQEGGMRGAGQEAQKHPLG